MVLEGLVVRVVLVVLEVLVMFEVLEGTVVMESLVVLMLLEVLEVCDDGHIRSWRRVFVLGAFTGKVGLKGVRGTKGFLEALDGERVETVEGVGTLELGPQNMVKGVELVVAGGGDGANIEEGRALEGSKIKWSTNVSSMREAGFGENSMLLSLVQSHI